MRDFDFKNIVKNTKANDEYYTPTYAVVPIIKYLEPNAKIWCPFDTPESNYVKRLTEAGFSVTASHISSGTNFFDCDIPECDYIVSNPPYSLKNEVFGRLFSLGKPFAMLVGVVGLFESKKRFDMFNNNNFEIMYLDKRVSFFKDFKDQKPSLNPPFSSVYLCSGVLPEKVIFECIVKK